MGVKHKEARLPKATGNRALALTFVVRSGYAPMARMKSSNSVRASCGPGAASG